jgi:hypothetical protein
MSVTVPKCGRISGLFLQRSATVFGQKVRVSHREIKDTQNCRLRERIAVINNDRKTSDCRLYYEIIDTVKEQLNNRFSEILKLKFVLRPDCGNFKHYSEKFLATAYESLLKSYGRYFDSPSLKTELSVIYSS